MVEVKACRICLASSDCKLFNMDKFGLVNGYEELLGDTMVENLPRYLCSYCCSLLCKFCQFKLRCTTSQALLIDKLVIKGKLSIDEIRELSINYESCNLIVQSDHQSIHVIRADDMVEPDKGKEETDGVIKSEDIVYDDGSMSDFEFMPSDECKVEVASDGLDLEVNKALSKVTARGPRTRNSKLNKTIRSSRKKEVKPLSRKTVKSRRKTQEDLDDNKPWSERRKFKETFAKVVDLTPAEQMDELLARRDSSNYINSSYKCDMCYKGFMHESTYINHMTHHDPSSGPLLCSICKIRTKTERQMRHHTIVVHQRKFHCKRCPHVSNTATQAVIHEGWHNGKTYHCKPCNKSFTKPTTYFSHVRSSHTADFVCELCGESFVNTNGLKQHKKRTHIDFTKKLDEGVVMSADGPYCKVCELRFYSDEAYSRHLGTSSKHPGSVRSCPECSGEFTSESELFEHITDVHRRRNIKLNKKNINQQEIKCQACMRVFNNVRNHYDHYRRIHLGIKKVFTKNSICDICGRGFTSNAALVIHQRTHSDDRPFKCSQCDKYFKFKAILNSHVKSVHSGIRPHVCGMCEKAFLNGAALKRHMRVHTGAKPFSCEHCGKTFSQSNSVKLHIHTVHFKLPTPYGSKRKCQVKIPLTYDQTMVDHTLKMLE